VKVSSVGTPSIYDISDANFTISSLPSVTVATPNGGENWLVGSDQSITWSSVGSVGDVEIEYSTNGGSTWATIVPSTQNSGSYQFAVPGPPSATCRIRISLVGTPSIYDISNANFTISSLPSVTLTVPNGGENWLVGSNQNITWSSVGSVGNVKIEYSTNGGSTWSSVVVSTSNTGSYLWTVPNGPSTTSRVKVSPVGTPSIYDISDANFTISSLPSVTVTAPNGGENWTVGDNHDITWSATSSVGHVKIEYSTNGGSTWSTVASSTLNSGSYRWTVPNSPSTTSRVKVSSVGTPSIYDISNADFTISSLPSITVIVPNGGENWTVGSNHDITWSSTGPVGNLNIEYSTNGGSTWSTIASGTWSSGAYPWTVPNSLSTTARVRVSSVGTPSIFDISNASFTISTPPSVTVTVPNGQEIWLVGSIHSITWSSTGAVGNVKLEYSTDGGSAWSSVVASTSNTGSYLWTVPNSPSTTSRVRVSSVGTPSIYDISNADFTISTLPSVVVTAPNGLENWTVGDRHNITWSSTSSVGNVKIEYSTNGGSTWSTVVSSTWGGSYPWTVPNSPSTTARVKVSSVGTPSIHDMSDNDFTISVKAVVLGAAAPFGGFGGGAGMTNQGILTTIDGDIGTTGVSTTMTGFHDSVGDVYTETTLNIGTVGGRIYTAPPPPGGAGVGGTAATFAIATAAAHDALIAFNSMSPASLPGGVDPGAGQLGGLTLSPAVYKAASGTFLLTGSDLTLDGRGDQNAVWIFQTAAGLTIGAPGFPRSIILINGAQAKNVFWYVGSAARIEDGCSMVGTIIASAGVTISTAGELSTTRLEGRALGLHASVTMVNTIINVPTP
jgi:hypothetical protein